MAGFWNALNSLINSLAPPGTIPDTSGLGGLSSSIPGSASLAPVSGAASAPSPSSIWNYLSNAASGAASTLGGPPYVPSLGGGSGASAAAAPGTGPSVPMTLPPTTILGPSGGGGGGGGGLSTAPNAPVTSETVPPDPFANMSTLSGSDSTPSSPSGNSTADGPDKTNQLASGTGDWWTDIKNFASKAAGGAGTAWAGAEKVAQDPLLQALAAGTGEYFMQPRRTSTLGRFGASLVGGEEALNRAQQAANLAPYQQAQGQLAQLQVQAAKMGMQPVTSDMINSVDTMRQNLMSVANSNAPDFMKMSAMHQADTLGLVEQMAKKGGLTGQQLLSSLLSFDPTSGYAEALKGESSLMNMLAMRQFMGMGGGGMPGMGGAGGGAQPGAGGTGGGGLSPQAFQQLAGTSWLPQQARLLPNNQLAVQSPDNAWHEYDMSGDGMRFVRDLPNDPGGEELMGGGAAAPSTPRIPLPPAGSATGPAPAPATANSPAAVAARGAALLGFTPDKVVNGKQVGGDSNTYAFHNKDTDQWVVMQHDPTTDQWVRRSGGE